MFMRIERESGWGNKSGTVWEECRYFDIAGRNQFDFVVAGAVFAFGAAGFPVRSAGF